MAVEAVALLDLFPEADDGLKQPLQTPTPSLVFIPESREDLGLVGIIRLPDDAPLQAGSHVNASVVFPEEGSGSFVQPGTRFNLWNGRTVGTAEIRELTPS